MLPFEDRYSRQRRLPEVGQFGQLKLDRARLQVAARGGDASWVETLYLHRAGIGQLTLSTAAQAPPFVHQGAFVFDATRTVAAGAHRALQQLRAQLGISAP